MTRKLPFRFLHCADLHLDSPFEGVHVLDPKVATHLREATFKAFDRVVELALCRHVDLLIVAGDVYDGADKSLRAQLKFRDALTRAAQAGIRSFVVHGNHDPLDGWDAGLSLPDGVHRFGGQHVECVSVERDGVPIADVYGISFKHRDVRDNLAARFQRRGEAPFAIGVMHANVGGDPRHDNYAPCTQDDLKAARMDYWALGHIHQTQVVREDQPCIVYPGNTQGRSIRETGPRGCYVITVGEAGEIEREFVETDVIRWFDERVDVSGIQTIDALLDHAGELCEDARRRADGRGAVIRLRLVGRSELHAGLHRREVDLATVLREREVDRPDFVWVESVQRTTRPPIDVAHRRSVEDFVGDFLRAAEGLRNQPNGMSGVRALLRKRPESAAIAGQLDQLTDADLQNVLDEAETLGLDFLLGGEA